MKKVLNIVLDVLIWVFVAFAAMITFIVFTSTQNAEGIPSIGGRMLFTVQTDSMEPTISVGSMVMAKKVTNFADLKKDDIITFYMDDGTGQTIVNTHRIIEVKENGPGSYSYVTKGDHNSMVDPDEVKISDIIGVYSGKIPVVGKAVDFMKTKTGFFVCILLPLIAFFLYELIRFIMVVIEGKREMSGVSAEEEEEIKKKAIEEYLAKQAAEAEKTASDVVEKVEEKASDDAEDSSDK